MNEIVKIQTFTITRGRLIRNNSGTYACPYEPCWRINQTAIPLGATVCLNCGAKLEWDLNRDE